MSLMKIDFIVYCTYINTQFQPKWLTFKIYSEGVGNSALPFQVVLPNQELSRAKPKLHGATVDVCSFYKRSGLPLYNLPAVHLRFTARSLHVCLLVYFNKGSTYERKI